MSYHRVESSRITAFFFFYHVGHNMTKCVESKNCWRGYRWARRAFLSSFFMGPALTLFLFAKQQSQDLDSHLDQVLAVLLLPTGITFFMSGLICHWWPCPRCKKMFFISAYFSNDFAQSCQHCGQKKWAEVIEDADSTARQDVC